MNNIIHNNEGYGVVLVKPRIFSDLQENAQGGAEGAALVPLRPSCPLSFLAAELSRLSGMHMEFRPQPDRCSSPP